MKKILLGILIAILALGAVLDTKDYVLGNKFDETKLYGDEGVLGSYGDTISDMENNLTEAGMDIASRSSRIYKLPNNHYYILQMFESFYRKSDYLYTGLIEIKNANETELTYPDNKLELIEVNKKFEQKSWKVNSKAGTFDFKVGKFGDVSDDDKQMMDDDGKHGLSISLTPKEGVITVGRNGIWFDNDKRKIGMQNAMKSYATEKEAVNAVKKDDFGKLIGVIKSKQMNFYVYRNQIDIFKEYTIIPVSLKDNKYTAGKYERFTYETDSITDIKAEEQVDNVNYTLRFQQSSDKFEKIANQLKDGDMHIAVKVRGEGHAK
ncbi:hypothetical protein BFS35_010190 [Macrococcoides goetzii]|uniref:Uncharacterized protein n=1 Tax=Macrococcoides goetzii TaxID=1891097 RepID=A0A2G5NLL6_9STAP|nr:hypothetical protein [Macrococcus goetzii]RAI80145.1 hypothetical protein BFS35_010190 [Macrococcus goetzii]